MPQTLTRNHGLFLLEEYTAGAWRYELGLRHEWQDIDADGRPDTDHSGTSMSAGAVWTFVRSTRWALADPFAAPAPVPRSSTPTARMRRPAPSSWVTSI